MEAFISADMEGITGVADARDVVKGEADYADGQKLMAGDVNAAVEGALAAGAEAVVVNDSHASMTNLARADLHEDARLIRGSSKPRSMMQGLVADHDVAFFVGYHAMAGTAGAVLNHTFIGHELLAVRVNHREVGELGWNAGLAAALDVPVGLVTGDDKTAVEAEETLETVETTVVKDGIDRFTADCRPPSEARRAIREGAMRAVERATNDDFDQPCVAEPVTIEADWSATNHALRASGLPGVERLDGRTTRVEAETYPEAYEASVAMFRAGAAGRNEWYG